MEVSCPLLDGTMNAENRRNDRRPERGGPRLQPGSPPAIVSALSQGLKPPKPELDLVDPGILPAQANSGQHRIVGGNPVDHGGGQ